MANKKAPEKLSASSSKIANLADLLLQEDGHEWEIDELHLSSKNAANSENVICKYVFEDGKWVLKCFKS